MNEWWMNPEPFAPETERFSDFNDYFPGANMGMGLGTLFNKSRLQDMYARKLNMDTQRAFVGGMKQAPNMAAAGVKAPVIQQSLQPFMAGTQAPPAQSMGGIAELFGAEALARQQHERMQRMMGDIKKHNEPSGWEKYGGWGTTLALMAMGVPPEIALSLGQGAGQIGS